MKKIFFLFLVIVVAALYFWPAKPDSGIQRVKTRIADMFSSVSSPGKDYNQELAAKQVELQSYEEVLKQTEAQIEQWKTEAESRICPTTGRPGIFELKEDPRPNLREKIDRLRQEIAELERMVNK